MFMHDTHTCRFPSLSQSLERPLLISLKAVLLLAHRLESADLVLVRGLREPRLVARLVGRGLGVRALLLLGEATLLVSELLLVVVEGVRLRDKVDHVILNAQVLVELMCRVGDFSLVLVEELLVPVFERVAPQHRVQAVVVRLEELRGRVVANALVGVFDFEEPLVDLLHRKQHVDQSEHDLQRREDVEVVVDLVVEGEVSEREENDAQLQQLDDLDTDVHGKRLLDGASLDDVVLVDVVVVDQRQDREQNSDRNAGSVEERELRKEEKERRGLSHC